MKAYAEFGLGKKVPLLGANALVDETLLRGMGDTAVGIVSIGHYSATLDTPESRAFVKEYDARHNAWPTRHSENGYVSGQLIVAAVTALKGELDERGKVREAIRAAVTAIVDSIPSVSQEDTWKWWNK